MKSIGGVLLAVAILLVMVTIHEFGHYVAGKILGFKINEFSVGFGPAIFKKRSKKTGELFALRVVPLGGYCAFDGEDEFDDEETSQGENKEENEPFQEYIGENAKEDEDPTCAVEQSADETETLERANGEDEYPEPKGERFNDQPPWKRIIVLVAGATMNYILALFLIVLMFATFGRPLYQTTVEYPDGKSPTQTVVETPLQTGDIILKIDNRNLYMITDYIDALDDKKAGEEVPILVLRDGKETPLTLTLTKDINFVNMSDTNTLLSTLGVYSLHTETQKEGFFQTIGSSLAYSVKIGGTVLRSLGELLTGKLGVDAMGGPITTIKVTSEVASSGLLSLLNIASFIGVNLAVFNLLPIPALDGCKVIFCLIEWIRKKPVNRKVETIIHLVGIIFLFAFAILVDLLQLF